MKLSGLILAASLLVGGTAHAEPLSLFEDLCLGARGDLLLAQQALTQDGWAGEELADGAGITLLYSRGEGESLQSVELQYGASSVVRTSCITTVDEEFDFAVARLSAQLGFAPLSQRDSYAAWTFRDLDGKRSALNVAPGSADLAELSSRDGNLHEIVLALNDQAQRVLIYTRLAPSL